MVRSTFILFVLAIFTPTGGFAFDLQGHRGARGLAPENTLAAFAAALRTGVTTLELDIAVTADGVVVVSHDAALNPALTRNAAGQWLTGIQGPAINTLTLAQLQTYDVGRINPASAQANLFSSQLPSDGQRIPTLAAVFELVTMMGASGVKFNIETKLDPLQPDASVSPELMTKALLKVVRDAGMAQRVTVQSFDWRSLQVVQQLAPNLPTSCLTAQFPSNDSVRDSRWTAGFQLDDYPGLPWMVKAAGCVAWSPNSAALTQSLLRQAHSLGLQVLPWTVNARPDMVRLLDWGVDGIITDYPDRLRSLLGERGIAMPTQISP